MLSSSHPDFNRAISMRNTLGAEDKTSSHLLRSSLPQHPGGDDLYGDIYP